jgi:hypothetical protein
LRQTFSLGSNLFSCVKTYIKKLGSDRLAQVVARGERHLAHADRLQLSRQLPHLRRPLDSRVDPML